MAIEFKSWMRQFYFMRMLFKRAQNHWIPHSAMRKWLGRLWLCDQLKRRKTVNWSCRIHWLHLCREFKKTTPRYDIKPFDGKAPVILELWRMWSTPLLPSLPGPLWPGVVAPDRVLIYGSNRTVWHLNWVKINYLY